MASVRGSDLEDAVVFFGSRNLPEISEAIRHCDLGVIPNRKSIFTRINTPTRIFEYLSQGKPVIAPAVPGIQDYFGPDDLIFFELGDAKDLASKIEFAVNHPQEVAASVTRGQGVYARHKWSSERRKFHTFVGDLTRTQNEGRATIPRRNPALETQP
jgi:glycosyltransferase involved in cell wall biosynthesis